MYLQFFNLKTDPFTIAPDPHFLYMSEQHQEGLAHLLYGINHGGGFVALTGEVGTGKTTLCRSLLEQLPDEVDVALVFNPKLSALELLASICDELQITYDEDKQSLKHLIDNLNKHLLTTHANGKRTVLIIDEAQNLSLDVLEQIRLLTNLETPQTKLLQIILVGQPELKTLLEKPELRQLNQRITARYHLPPLSSVETGKYIKHRLKRSGATVDIFNSGAVKKIYKFSKGIPRLINVICDKAMLGAYVTEKQVVTAQLINQAAKEVLNASQASSSENYLLTKLTTSLIILAMLIVLPYYFFNDFLQELKAPPDSISPLNKPKIFVKPTPDLPIILKKPEISYNLYDQDQQPEIFDFKSFLKLQSQSVKTSLAQLGMLWSKDIPNNSGCEGIKPSGLICLIGKSNWQDVIALNRPVILKFSISSSENRYLLLIGLDQGQPIFKFKEDSTFPLEQILTYWDGDFIMLWQSPIQDSKAIHLGQSSRGVFWIRKQLSLIPDHSLTTLYSIYFNDELKNEVIQFQQQKNLVTDGIVGAKTFIHLQNIDPDDASPKLKIME